MNRVLDRLWIGTSHDLDGLTPFDALGIKAIVDLRDGDHPPLPNVVTHRTTNRDGDPWDRAQVESILAFVHEHMEGGGVLIACAAGMSRSASIVCGYLVRCGWSPAEAFAHLKRVRPEIAPIPKMLHAATNRKPAQMTVKSADLKAVFTGPGLKP